MTLRIEDWTLEQVAAAAAGGSAGGTPAVRRGAGGSSAFGGELGDPDTRITHVSSDTRTISDGALFVALSGERFDGHDYVAAAREAGATAALVSRRVEVPIAQVLVDDTLDGLQRLGHALFEEARAAGVFSIALTGSNGKTTTKELLAALWGTLGRTHATRGNLNNHIGVPLTLCAMPSDAEVLVLEMGANRPGDIGELIAIAPADVRVVTSIGAAHLEGFGGLDGVRRTKAEIFNQVDARTVAIVPASERGLIPDGFPGRVVSVGEGGDVTYERAAGGVRITGLGFDAVLPCPLPGTHNAHNLATAVATLLGVGRVVDVRALSAALENLVLPGGRWREVRFGDWTFLDDAYNANPSSVRASWDAFVEIREAAGAVEPANVVAVVGEMFELGPDADAMHRETARWVAERGGASAYAFVGSFAQKMAESARAATKAEVRAFETPQQAAQWLLAGAPATVYLKASRGQRLEDLIEIIRNDAEQGSR